MTGSAVSSSSALPAAPRAVTRRFPIGAEYLGRDKTHVRVWAPAADRVEVVLQSGDATSLDAEDGGYFSGLLVAAAGMRYQFRLGTADRLPPGAVSPFQAQGPSGASGIR